MERWSGKIGVVTGASSGIGAAIVKMMLDNGITVVGMARRHELVRQLSTSKNLYSLKVDLTKEEEILDAFKWIASNLGVIHILVNSVGIIWATKSFHTDTKLWKNSIDTDLFGVLIPTKIVAEQMIANDINGQIIHIHGVSGHNVYVRGLMGVAMSKTAITTATEYLRKELLSIKKKIKVTCISPGAVDTEILNKNVKDQNELLPYAKKFEDAVKLKSIDIVNAVYYVLDTPPHVQVDQVILTAVGSRL